MICPGTWGLTGSAACGYARNSQNLSFSRFRHEVPICSHLVFLVVAEDDVHHSWYLVIVDDTVCWMHKSCMIPLE